MGSVKVEDDDKRKLDFASAKSGKITSVIIGNTFANDISDKDEIFVRSFIPIISENNRLEAVLELYYDVTPLWKQPIKIQIISTSVVSSIFIVLYIALLVTITKAEKLITRQHETNVELAAAKARAETENLEKSKFLANISHELRTPLNAIIGFSEIIKDEVMGALGNDQYKDYVKDIHSSGVHLLSLINDILDYSKAEAGKLEVEVLDVDVTKIMKSCLRLVSPRAESAGVALIDEIPNEHFVIKTDAKRLKQIVLNLLSNSVKFTPANGKVTLHLWYNVTKESLVVEVSDTGIGIAPKDISKVMSTFGQVENEYNRKYEGTGLGLPLSKKLVELMGGTFHIESDVGKGTKVTINLPKDQKAKTNV